MSNRILVVLAHPDLAASRVNRAMVEAVRDLPGITVHDLFAAYPEGPLDVAREQALVAAHDILVFQHPLFWYSAPARLKEWQDRVLAWGWAYGPGGEALVGKTFFSAVSTGAPQQAYQAGGVANFGLSEFLRPFQQMATYVRMNFAAPFVYHGAMTVDEAGIAAHAAAWRQHLQTLVQADAVELAA